MALFALKCARVAKLCVNVDCGVYSKLSFPSFSKRCYQFEANISVGGQEYHLRPCKLSDYEAIMDIGRYLFDGMDYLPYTFHTLMGDKSWSSYVVLKEQELLGFYGHHVISGGKTLMGRGGRIQPSYQNHGIMSKLEPIVMKKTQELLPSIQQIYGTLKSTSPYLKGVSRVGGKLLFTRNVVCYKLSKQSNLDIPFESSPDLTEVTQSRMSHLLTDTTINKFLFSPGYISVRWTCLPVNTTDDIDFIFRFSQNKYATYASESDCRLFTLPVHFRCPAGYVYHMECYGDTSPSLFIPHLKRHLFHASQVCPQNVDLFFYAYCWDSEFTLNNWIGKELMKYGFEKYPLDYNYYVGTCRLLSNVFSSPDSKEL